MQIGYLKAFSDNYLWFIQHERDLFVVDLGSSTVVLDYIITTGLDYFIKLRELRNNF